MREFIGKTHKVQFQLLGIPTSENNIAISHHVNFDVIDVCATIERK